MDPFLKEIVTWAITGIGAAMFGLCAFFLKKMVDKHESNGRDIQKLRSQMNRITSAVSLEFQRQRSAVKLIAERAKIRYHDIDELCDDEPPNLGLNRDSQTME